MLHKIKISILVVFAALFVSCEDDFLETTPTDAVTPAIALGTVEDMEKVLNGVHSTLYSQLGGTITGAGNNRAGNQYWIPLGDNLAGELIHSADANNLGWRSEMQWNSHTQETSETTEILWYHRYNTILHANLLIEKISSGDLPVTPRLRAIEGQAYAYRAYALLSLVQHYAKGYLVGNPATDKGVPIILDPQTTGPRATVAEVYNQIGLDLDASIAAFANATPRGTGGARDKSQLNINVAHGLKARWALSKGDWQTAATSAVAARQGFPLMNEAAWKSGFNTNDLSEVIWGSNVIGAETTFFRAYFYLASNTFNGSQIRNNPKIADRRLIDAIPATDYRG
ncbi:MAG: RagB/SusD family nutrient uptake outer membrane protein, partial [Flavobacteriales bacterium]